MTTITNISDSSFIITFATSGFDSTVCTYSETVEHSEMEWAVGIRRNGDSLACYLRCFGNNTNGWTAIINFLVELKKKQSVNNNFVTIQTADNVKYNTESSQWGFQSLLKLEKMNEEYKENDRITVQLTVKILSIAGNYPARRHNFFEQSQYSDGVLIINDTKYFVSKAILALQSSFFKSEFYDKLAEECNEKFEGVNDEGCLEFLQLMYQCSVEITQNNVSTLLILAAHFKVPRIIQRCEMFLISSNRVERLDKLKYAQQFNMVGLRMSTIQSFETIEQLKKCSTEFNSMDARTLSALLNKYIEIGEKPSVPAAPSLPAN